jgi:8-oxo-dGTP pyrophosphatase MutT (NUDIX family)
VSASGALLDRLGRALHGLGAAPPGPAWNAGEVDDLVPRDRVWRHAAVLVPLVERNAGWQVLLTRRTDTLRHHAGQISFPGGGIEPQDGGPVQAALREAWEEVGLAPESIRPLGFLDPYDTISAFHVLPVVACVAGSFAPVVDPVEVAEVFEVPLDFFLDIGNCRRIEVEAGGRPRHYDEFAYGSYRIWGATAAMLVNLRDRLRG